MASCRRHRATLLLAKLDRLGRNVAFVSALMETKTDFLALDAPYATPLLVHILAAFAEHEREMISQRTKAALAAAKARGVKLGVHGAVLAANHKSEATAFAQTISERVSEVRGSGAETLPGDRRWPERPWRPDQRSSGLVADRGSTGTEEAGGMTNNERRLAEALLEIAGRHVVSETTARRHIRALENATYAVADPDIRERLGAVRQRLFDTWGGQRDELGKPLPPKAISIFEWLATRKDPRRTFGSLRVAAKLLLEGMTSMSVLRANAFALTGQLLICPVSVDQFRRWVLQTGIAVKERHGVYVPGPKASLILMLEFNDIRDRVDQERVRQREILRQRRYKAPSPDVAA